MKRRLLYLLGAVLYTAAIFWNLAAGEGLDRTYVRLTQETRASPFPKEASLCLWGRTPGQAVGCPITGRISQAARVALWGNPGLLGLDALAWQQGCYVDEKTALALFGTADCAAQVLNWQGETYTVLGTVEAAEPVLVTMAQEGEGMTMGVLPIPADRGSYEAGQQMQALGLAGEVLDLYPFWALNRNLLLLFPAIVLGKMTKRAGRLRWIPIALLLWQFAVVPSAMIPSRWSDFAFWGRWWEGQRENITLLLHTPLGNDQLQMGLDMVKSVVTSIAANLALPKGEARGKSF